MKISSTIRRNMQVNGKGAATIFAGRQHSWSQFGERIAKLAAGLSKLGLDLGVPVINPEDSRPLGPGVVWSAILRGPGQQLKVDQAFTAVAYRGSDAVGSGVASTYDNDILVLR